MKIPIGFPFNQRWNNAYLVVNDEPRRNIILFNSDEDRTTISFARYLASCYFGFYISEEFVVDHIDGDTMNDSLANYQILTHQQNVLKGYIETGRSKIHSEFKCGVCGNVFSKPRNQTHFVKPIKSTYCSRSCSGKSVYFGPSLHLRDFQNVKELPTGWVVY